MKINWKVRLKNKAFWISLIPALIVLFQQILRLFGVEFDVGSVQENILAVVNTLFVVLSILGIVVDPTTHGMSDSMRAMRYEKPHADIDENDVDGADGADNK